MKAKLTTLTLIALLGVSGTTIALADQDYSEGGMYHNLQLLANTPQVKGMQGRPAERIPVNAANYGEGNSLEAIRQWASPGSPSTAVRTGHSEYEEGTSTFHAPHADQR